MKAESPYFFKKRRLLRIKLMRAPYLKKRRLYFLKKCNFAKNRKKAPKKAPFASMVLWMPGIEKAPFFWHRTNMVLNKGAFSSLKTRIYKLKRGFLKCFETIHSFQERWVMFTDHSKVKGKGSIGYELTMHFGDKIILENMELLSFNSKYYHKVVRQKNEIFLLFAG